MKYDPIKHHRRSIRLKGYDYHNAGAYFVTICTKNRECVLDDSTVDGIINAVWQTLPSRFPTIELDEFVIMPNHVHFIIWIINRTVEMPLAGVHNAGKPHHLDWIKSNDPTRRAKFWQGNYYEHIIRTDKELNAIRKYIIDNPANWKNDRDNSNNRRRLTPPQKVEDYLEDINCSHV